MAKCAYCSSELKKGTGTLYVYRTGELAYYCSNSCFKNHVIMGRKINSKLVKKDVKPKPVVEKKQQMK